MNVITHVVSAMCFCNFIWISMLLACAIKQSRTIMVQLLVQMIVKGLKTFSPQLNTIISVQVAYIGVPEIIDISRLHVQKEALRFLVASSVMVMGKLFDMYSVVPELVDDWLIRLMASSILNMHSMSLSPLVDSFLSLRMMWVFPLPAVAFVIGMVPEI